MTFSKYGAVVYVVTFSNSLYHDGDCGVLFYTTKYHKDRAVGRMKANGFTAKVKEVVLPTEN